jgi:GT2 family glycosyltransferase
MGATPRLSVVIPARNAQASLARCLEAVRRNASGSVEIVVVDDGSQDGSGAIASSFGATVVRHDVPTGPAAARNAGARAATAPIVLFVDADVVLADDAIERIVAGFDDDPDRAAIFGSYDDAPEAGAFVSDYRNIFHHFVHQSSREESQSFWAGCGAVRRPVFLALGGFDERYRRASIEDIEFGGRLARAGHRIHLDKRVRCTHLKRWTFASILATDIRDRAYPWTRLMLEERSIPTDLNLQPAHRASALLVWLALLSLAGLLILPEWRALLLVMAAAICGVVVLNRSFYQFLYRQRSLTFAVGGVLLHSLYYAYASATFAWCWFEHRLQGLAQALRRFARPQAARGASPR